MSDFRAVRGTAFSRAERQDLVRNVALAFEMHEQAQLADDTDTERAASDVIHRFGDQYRDAVPYAPLTRCPITGDVVVHSIDYYDLDGLWWAYNFNFRPPESLPPTFFAFSGALKLAGPPPRSPLPAMPGPEKPFVIPRILEQESMKAVVSSVLVGEHIGFPIFYFSSRVLYDLDRTDDWGLSFTRFEGASGEVYERHYTPRPIYNDYDLAPWIEQGKLLWIAPGDGSLTLRDTTAGCPYRDLPGRPEPYYIQDGNVRYWRE